MRDVSIITAGFAALMIAGAGSAAAEAQASQQDDATKPVTERHDTVESAIATPVEDLNLKKTEIPEVLLRAEANPYDLTGRDRCEEIAGEMALLDEALGPDKDQPVVAEKKDDAAAKVLRAGVEAVEPFRGVVRWLTGANAHEKKVQEAVQAGFARRGFLKGRALQMNCPPGAAPAWYKPAVAPPPPTQAIHLPEKPNLPPVEVAVLPPAEPAPEVETLTAAQTGAPPHAALAAEARRDPFAPPPFDPFAEAGVRAP